MLPNMAHPDSQKAAKAGQIPPMIDMPYFEDGKPVERPLGIYSDDLYTGKMLGYMEQSRRAGKPFFAYLAFHHRAFADTGPRRPGRTIL